jgi:hypothetical protein
MPEPRRVRLDDEGMPIRREDAVESEELPEPCDCPHLDAADWDGVESDWSDITFVSTTTNAVMGAPVGYGGVRDELARKAKSAGAEIPEDAMLLNGSGRFRRPVMLEVEGDDLSDKEIVRPGGVAFTRLLEAPWGEMQKVVDLVEAEAAKKYGRKPDNVWVWYLTCRRCSKARNFETLIVAHYKDAG